MATTDNTTQTKRASSPSEKAKNKAKSARDTAVAKADEARDAVGDAFESNPLSAVLGAIATGAVVAALLPVTQREVETLGPIADRLRDAADEAIAAAKEAGTGELTAAGLTVAAASDGFGGIVGKVVKAAGASASAAALSVRQANTNQAGVASSGAPADASIDNVPAN